MHKIPLLALREIVLNAIIHRDYTRNSDIKIVIYDDIVEIISVGGFVNGLTIDDISNGRSELRNKVVANLFKELNFIESWGSGIGKVRNSCDKRGVKFELREKGLFVEAVFYRPISETVAKPSDTVGKVSDNLISFSFQEETIIAYIKKHNRIVSKDVKKLLGIKESRTRELLKQMVEKGLIVRLGRGRSTSYIKKDKNENEI